MPHLNSEIIAILDFGSQYTQLIARRVRENHVYSKIYPYSTKASMLKEEGVTAIILSGGPQSVTDLNAPIPDEKIFQLGVPILGICYGLQLFGQLLGGRVTASNQREYGYGVLSTKTPSLLLKKFSLKLKYGILMEINWNVYLKDSRPLQSQKIPNVPLFRTKKGIFTAFSFTLKYLIPNKV